MASWMKRREVDKLDFPPEDEFMEMIVDMGARGFGCQISMNMMDLTIEDFVDVAEVLCAMEMLKSANGAQVVFV